jgi:hypothetical protein
LCHRQKIKELKFFRNQQYKLLRNLGHRQGKKSC